MRCLTLAVLMFSASGAGAADPVEPLDVHANPMALRCGMMLLTSNPPKRVLAFTLDATRYLAVVTLTADRPQLLPLDQKK